MRFILNQFCINFTDRGFAPNPTSFLVLKQETQAKKFKAAPASLKKLRPFD